MALTVTIDGTEIERPTKPIEISKYALTKSGRVADGTMTMDYIADKSTFQFEWESIKVSALRTILDLVEAFPTMFHTLTINENGAEASYNVYFGAVKRTPYRTDNNGYWYYKDVKFQAIEK